VFGFVLCFGRLKREMREKKAYLIISTGISVLICFWIEFFFFFFLILSKAAFLNLVLCLEAGERNNVKSKG
jgi:hypothetical protein